MIVVGKNPGHPVPEEAELYRMAVLQAHTYDEDMAAELLFDAMVESIVPVMCLHSDKLLLKKWNKGNYKMIG